MFWRTSLSKMAFPRPALGEGFGAGLSGQPMVEDVVDGVGQDA